MRQEFGPLELILDGGDCKVGLESTIVDLSGDENPVILRPKRDHPAAGEAVCGRHLASRASSIPL
jgi:L-threonylcarbamoyladenylate synthase